MNDGQLFHSESSRGLRSCLIFIPSSRSQQAGAKAPYRATPAIDDPASLGRTPSYVCINDGKGHFPACQPLPTESATSIVAADFDGDGALDLFVPHRDGGQSILLWNDGKGHFPTATKVGAAKAWIRMGAAGDLDGDGRPDLATIDERLKATFIIFNRGERQFGEPVRLPGAERPTYCLAIADLNRDNGRTSSWATCSCPDRYTSTRGRAERSTRSPGTTEGAPCTAWPSPTSMETVGRTSWRRALMLPTASGSTRNRAAPANSQSVANYLFSSWQVDLSAFRR